MKTSQRGFIAQRIGGLRDKLLDGLALGERGSYMRGMLSMLSDFDILN